jgi:PAS domain S-box-containing protein
MHKPKRIDVLLVIMACIALAIGGVAIGLLYESTIELRRERLAAAVELQAEAFNRRLSVDSEAYADEALNEYLSATLGPEIYRNLGAEGRLLLVRWTPGGGFVGPLTAAMGQAEPAPAPGARPLSPSFAAELTRPPGWEAKSFFASDAQGRTVLAAFAPLARPGLGVVAEVGMSALRRPFIDAAAIVLLIAVFLIAVGAFVFLAVTDPILRQMREGEARFREMFENMRWGALVCRATEAERGRRGELVLTDLNRAAERIDRIARQDAIGRPPGQALAWIARTGLVDVMQRVARTGTAERIARVPLAEEAAQSCRDIFVYRLPTGEIVTLYDDITPRIQAEQSLRESEARWRSIIEMQTVAIVIVDEKTEIRYANKAAETLFGKSAHELANAPFGCPITDKDVTEIEIIRPDRSLVYAEMRAIPMRAGGAEHYLLFIQDVSAHRRAAGDLRKLFQAIEQSPSSVVITDVDGRIEYVNPKFTEVSGYVYAEVVGKNPSVLKSGHTSPEEYKALWETISAGKVWRGEFQNRKKSGALYWELAAIAPVRDAQGRIAHYVAVKEDITERKITEEQLRMAQRLEVIGQLTGGIAHDFNNLLGIVVGNLQLLEENPDLDAEARELIADAIWSAERGAQLTHRLLAFARRQRLRPKVLALNEVVSEMIELLRRTLGEKINVREAFEPELWPTRIDRGQLESALLNLVVNARDAMPKGGTVTISTANVAFTQAEAPPVSGARLGEYVMISVEDTGTGMPKEVLDKIFEPFFTTKKVGHGSGLGLSMVYGFVRQSDGYIAVDSAEDAGTTVRLFLPRSAGVPAAAPDEMAPAAKDGEGDGGETILVVEDDERVLRTTMSILRRHGYRVLHATNAADALAVARKEARLDLLFTDLDLPDDVGGLALARQVLAFRPGARALLASGYDPKAGTDTDAGEVPDVLPKPYRQKELIQKIREVLERPSATHTA